MSGHLAKDLKIELTRDEMHENTEKRKALYFPKLSKEYRRLMSRMKQELARGVSFGGRTNT